MSFVDLERGSLRALTHKQLECLKLVADGFTSKEIAIRLGVSRHAVDQRLDSARRVLGAETRREAAKIYRSLAPGAGNGNDADPAGGAADESSDDTCEFPYDRTTGDLSGILSRSQTLQQEPRQPEDEAVITLGDIGAFGAAAPWDADPSAGLSRGYLEGFGENARRMIIILSMTILLLLAALAALAVAHSLTGLISATA